MITLLTDFGTADYFIPAVKGAILSINPQAQIIDLTHEIPAQDVAAAAFTLGACYRDFPAGTIHLAVVDPGVGSARRAIVARAGKQLFVGPDNGIFSYVYARESQVAVFQIERDEYFRQPVSATFHGRDVFAPVAAWLARGLAPENLGREIGDYVRFEIPTPRVEEAGKRIVGAILHIDRFGNCITNLTARELPPQSAPASARLLIARHEVAQFGSHFEQAAGPGSAVLPGCEPWQARSFFSNPSSTQDPQPGRTALPGAIRSRQLFAYLGSAGFWEIGLWRDSAARRLAVARGAEVILEFR